MGSETILVVEDQAPVRTLARTALRPHGYKVLEAGGANEALLLPGDPAVAIDLMLTAIVMPEMPGRLLAAEARVKRPGMRVLYMSGYSEPGSGDEAGAGDGIA